MPSPTQSSTSSSRPRGISLGGVIASLAGIALLAGIAIPTFFARHDVTLDNAAILMARDLRTVQNRAAHLGQPTSLRFDLHGWRAFDAGGRPLTRFATQERIERRLDADAVFEGVTVESIDFDEAAELGFDAHGRPDRGGSLEVVYRGQRRRVHVSQDDGRLVIEGLKRRWVDDGL
jgi:acyl-coenzyme A thioesterase PaaI-like protein